MSQHPSEQLQTNFGARAPLELEVCGERRVFDQPFVLIGRDERSDLRLDDTAISRRHAYLQQLGERIFCVDLDSRTGVHWGDECRPAGWLCPDQGLYLGPFTLQLSRTARPEGETNGEAAPEWDPLQDRLNDTQILPRIAVEDRRGEVLSQLRMNRAIVLVGSAPTCRLRLRDARISRFHCSLVRTPEGILMIDLLSSTGTYLNGEPVRGALLQEGDRLRVGPYTLYVCYRDVAEALEEDRSAREPAAIEMTALPPQRDWMREAEELGQQLADSQAECDRLREQSRTFESQLAEMAGLHARLEAAEAEASAAQREQLDRVTADFHVLETERDQLKSQLAEMTSLRERLEAAESAARELEVVRTERDRWQTETQELQVRIAADASEQEELQKRLDQESALLREARADIEVWNAEHDAVKQQLQEGGKELAQARDETRRLQADLDQARHGHLQAAESQTAELQSLRSEYDRLREQIHSLESQLTEMAGLPARLEVAEANARELATIRAERDRWQIEAPEAQTRIEAEAAQREQLDCVTADLHAIQRERDRLESQLAEMAGLQRRLEAAESSARELDALRAERDRWQAEAREAQSHIAASTAPHEQVDRLIADLDAMRKERDRLLAEQQAPQQLAEQATARVSELERALSDAAVVQESAVAEMRTQWDAERQALETSLQKERQAREGVIQAALREAQDRFATEREEWRQRVEGAEVQIVWERKMFQEQSTQLRQQAGVVQAERDRLAARLTQTESSRPAASERPQTQAVPSAEPDNLRQVAARDQLFSDFRLLMGHSLGQVARPPTETNRPRSPLAPNGGQTGEPRRPEAVAQGVEAAWTEAAARPEPPAAVPNPPTDPPQDAPAPTDGTESAEDQNSWLWRKIRHIVAGK